MAGGILYPDPNAARGPGLATQPAPQFNNGLLFKEVGQSGLRAFGGYVRDEFLPQLQGRQAATMYREMADNSPIIGGMIFATHATMGKVEWRVNPANSSPEAEEMAEFVEGLRDDMDETWDEFVQEGLSMLEYGFAPMEIVYKKRLGQTPGGDKRPSKYDDGKIGWAKLPIRAQDTILKWFFNENGEYTGLTQIPYIGRMVDVPAEKFMLFRPSQHKNNPEGRSILRTSYRDYLFVRRMEEQEAIMYERLNGLPIVTAPLSLMEAAKQGDANASALLETLKSIARNVRIDEQMGIVLPSDVYDGANGPSAARMYTFEFASPSKGAGSTDSDKSIVRHQTAMMMSVLADFLTLGHGRTGTQALAVAKQDMFFQSIEGYLNRMAAVINRHGLSRLWALNGLDPDLMPTITPDLAQRIDLDVLSNFVLRLAQSGMPMFPNADLESALLDSAGLPDIAETGSADMIAEWQDSKPVPIVGPGAAALMPKPEAPVAPGSPEDKMQKMLKRSYAVRAVKLGLLVPSGTRSYVKRRGRMPTVTGITQGELFA